MSEANSTALIPIETPTLKAGSMETNPQFLEGVASSMQAHMEMLGLVQPASGDAALTSANLPIQSALHAQAQQRSMPQRPGEPARLTRDLKTNPEWLNWLECQLPGGGAKALEALPTRYDASPSAIVRSVDLLNELVAAPSTGVPRFLTALEGANPHSFGALVNTIADQHLSRYVEADPRRDRAIGQAQEEGRAMAAEACDWYEAHFQRELSQWFPHGRNEEEANARARFACLNGAFQEMLSHPYYQAIFSRAMTLIAGSPEKRLYGYDYDADSDLIEAEDLVKEFAADLAEMISRYVGTYYQKLGA